VLSACASEPAAWTYAPAPSKTPPPSAAASAGASDAASGNIPITASGVKFVQASVDVPAAEGFKIDFDNQDTGVPHNVAIHDGGPTGPEVFKGEIFAGPAKKTYDVPPLKAGTYGLSVGLIWWPIGIAIAIGYFTFLFRTFKGKVAMDDRH